jgi:small subunit ribosomal protein S2
MSTMTMRELLEAGVHFGHQTRRWNPKMKPYIYGERNGIYIIDLQKTVQLFKEARQFVVERAGEGSAVLFVATKRQAHKPIQDAATRCGGFTVTNRWLGGTLTNFRTIHGSIERLKKLEVMAEKKDYSDLTKKEILRLEKERAKLERSLGGIKAMDRLPGLLFIVDPKKEKIAVQEAGKMNIPVVGIVDTNCDPDGVDFVIPANDDAIKSIELFAGRIAEAVLEGKRVHEERVRARAAARPKDEAAPAAPAPTGKRGPLDPDKLAREARVQVDTKHSLRRKSLQEFAEQEGLEDAVEPAVEDKGDE